MAAAVVADLAETVDRAPDPGVVPVVPEATRRAADRVVETVDSETMIFRMTYRSEQSRVIEQYESHIQEDNGV
jgi:hypothetical protein